MAPGLADWFHRRLLVRGLRPSAVCWDHRLARGLSANGTTVRLTLDSTGLPWRLLARSTSMNRPRFRSSLTVYSGNSSSTVSCQPYSREAHRGASFDVADCVRVSLPARRCSDPLNWRRRLRCLAGKHPAWLIGCRRSIAQAGCCCSRPFSGCSRRSCSGGVVAFIYRRARSETASSFTATLVLLSDLDRHGDAGHRRQRRPRLQSGRCAVDRAFCTVVRDTQDTAYAYFLPWRSAWQSGRATCGWRWPELAWSRSRHSR